MARAVKHFGWRQFVEFIPAVKAVGFKMLPAVNAAVIGVLKQPGFESSAVGIELIYCFEDIQEDSLDGLFCFPIIAQDGAGNPEDQRAVPFEQDGQRIVASDAQGCHQVFISKGPKARGREEKGCQFFIR